MELTDAILAAGFWGSTSAVLYAYVGYPCLIGTVARATKAPHSLPRIDEAQLPTVTLLIAAHNEAEVIAERIENALAMDYPADRLSIAIASDGSDDATVAISERYGPRVRVFAYPQRSGKTGVLNATIPQLTSEVIVFSDANTSMERHAVRELVRSLALADVVAACGRLVLRDPTTGANVDSLYWRFETFLKRCEARVGGLLGANGAIYALRRSAIVPLPAHTIVDDFVLPLLAKMTSGGRIAYAPLAVAHEETAPDMRGEFRRRARIGVGGFQALWILRGLLHPRFGWTAFTFWSHKVLRWTCPFAMIVAFVTALALSDREIYRIAFLAQTAFYAAAALALLLPAGNPVCRAARVLPMFTSMNIALLVGFLRWARGQQSGIWKRTARAPARSLDG